MQSVICGDGPMGRALADELRDAGHAVRVLGRPATRHPPEAFVGADVVFDFSTAGSVVDNVQAALTGGCRRLVIGTTGLDGDGERVETALANAGAAAVVAPTFSPGATVLLRMVANLATIFARLGGYEPYVVEWHRAGKRDRPSGTAAELGRRLVEIDPVKRRLACGATGPAEADALEIVSLRAGAAPGAHVLGFDSPGETFEIRVTARDRRSYAAGARAAAEWLTSVQRVPGVHPFESLVDDILTSAERTSA